MISVTIVILAFRQGSCYCNFEVRLLKLLLGSVWILQDMQFSSMSLLTTYVAVPVRTLSNVNLRGMYSSELETAEFHSCCSTPITHTSKKHSWLNQQNSPSLNSEFW
ncbi:hypothetical protein C5167_022019 [Papaver somniferum]|uniref:Uncharacterized protein n=1 Tax=Papaver somniferum TaxID=3469 RepID=A0A4Y7JKR1_PAPSO|nr:hypothetical protein C5167_022019 [Papaver somniferum]